MTICQLPYFSYESKNFLLEAVSGTGKTDISMVLKVNNVSTRYFPHTKKFLEGIIPEVLHTECFNDQHLPFYKEVEDTEIAHLLEHILIQILYSEKTKILKTRTEYNGNTKWNWKKEKFGTFHIEIDSGYSDGKMLIDAISKAVEITENIINYPLTEPIAA